MRTLLVFLILFLAKPAAAAVKVSVQTAANLADADQPIPKLQIDNDTKSPDWRSSLKPGTLSLTAATEGFGASTKPASPGAAALTALVQGEVATCVTTAQQRIPWLRGAFALNFYQSSQPPTAVLFVDMSLLGDKLLNDCLGAIRVKQPVSGNYSLTFTVSRPTP